MARKKIKKSQSTISGKLLRFSVYLLVLFFFQEVVMRLCFPLPEISNFNRINYQILGKTDKKSDYIRNIKMTWKSTPDTDAVFVHDLNSYGYRDDEWTIKKDAKRKRIFFVGDSFVEGMMAEQDEVINKSFERRAMENGMEVETMNFGMMGVGLNEFLKLAADAIPVFKPDILFLVLCYNDIPFNKPFKPVQQLKPEYFNSYKPRLAEYISLYNKGISIPFRWSFFKKPYYPPVPSRNNPWSFYEDSLSKHVNPQIAAAMKKGDFNFFRTNWVLEEEKFLKAPADISKQIEALRNFTRSSNTELFIFHIPSRHQVSNYYYAFERGYCCTKICPDALDMTGERYHRHRRMLAKLCGRLEIPFYDLTPLIKAEEDKGNHMYWNFDDHLRAKGYGLIGRSMFDWWVGLRE